MRRVFTVSTRNHSPSLMVLAGVLGTMLEHRHTENGLPPLIANCERGAAWGRAHDACVAQAPAVKHLVFST